MGPSTDKGGGDAHGAPLWALTLFSGVGPGRVKFFGTIQPCMLSHGHLHFAEVYTSVPKNKE